MSNVFELVSVPKEINFTSEVKFRIRSIPSLKSVFVDGCTIENKSQSAVLQPQLCVFRKNTKNAKSLRCISLNDLAINGFHDLIDVCLIHYRLKNAVHVIIKFF